MEELQQRHRRELRDLQSRVTQKKKQASKKTRKGVNDECDRLEAELRATQQAEIDALRGDGSSTADPEDNLAATSPPEEQLGNLNLNPTASVDGDQRGNTVEPSTAAGSSPTVTPAPPESKKPSRQKARVARRAAEQEALQRQAAEEASALPDHKQAERGRMVAAMAQRGLREEEIRADGHCLYSAVADQLSGLKIPLAEGDSSGAASYKIVRARAAEHISQHADDFAPFLEEPLVEYVRKVRDTAEWGGQLELAALAKSYNVDINVLQDFDRVERIDCGEGDRTADNTLWLAYYKHGFGLGEHYNSLRKTP